MGRVESAIRGEIRQERIERERAATSNLLELLGEGHADRVIENLVFFVAPQSFRAVVENLMTELAEGPGAQEVDPRDEILFLADLYVALQSFLPSWNLTNQERDGGQALRQSEVESVARRVHARACTRAADVPDVATALLEKWRRYHVARFVAEGAVDAQSEAHMLVGDSVGEYLMNLTDQIRTSNLMRIAKMRVAGQSLTEISNDYASYLDYALYLGASFATTNPPLVDMEWVADSDRWNDVADSLILQHLSEEHDVLARLGTLEVVLVSMRLLRPIFLITEGEMGCVCLQVNPHLHAQAEKMVEDAQFFYEEMRKRLGGVPNVVFKLPGTLAGLKACRELTQRGMGVTITVNFGMFQHVPFLQAMQEGEAVFSCLVEMNGRLAYPVRDELLGKLSDLEAFGIDEAVAREAAAWSGIAVVKKLHSLLSERGYDPRRYKPLVASLRWYTGDGYDRLPSACPDITELVGISLISVFPNIRRAFDESPGVLLESERISAPVPHHIMDVLAHSEVFKQAYYIADSDWATADEDRFRPDDVLELADENSVIEWPPVRQTMAQFEEAYDIFVRRILARISLAFAKE